MSAKSGDEYNQAGTLFVIRPKTNYMGILANKIQLSGTYGKVCYYVVNGRTLVRAKSSLTRKRVLKDKAFEKTRQYAGNMGLASQIGSRIYRTLPMDIKGRWLFRAITGEAASLLYSGKTKEEVEEMLWSKYIDAPCAGEPVLKKGKRYFQFSSLETRKLLWKVFLERWEAQNKPRHVFKKIWDRRGEWKVAMVPRRWGLVPVL